MDVKVTCPTCRQERTIKFQPDELERIYGKHRDCRSCANLKAAAKKELAAIRMKLQGVSPERIVKLLGHDGRPPKEKS